MSLSIERYLAIRQLSSERSSKVLFWLPIIFSVVYNAPKFFELTTCKAPLLPIIGQYPNTTKLNLSHDLKNNYSDHENLQQNFTEIQNINLTLDATRGGMGNAFADNDTATGLNCGIRGLRPTAMRQNEMYTIFYVVISKVALVEIIPWMSVFILNILTWRRVKLFQERRARLLKGRETGNRLKYIIYRLCIAGIKGVNYCMLLILNGVILLFVGRNLYQETRTLLTMAVVFVFCQFFPIVGDFHELICTVAGYSVDGVRAYNVHIENCIHFGHFMLMVNSSVNFVFYMMSIAKFRQGFVKVNQSYVDIHSVYNYFDTVSIIYNLPYIFFQTFCCCFQSCHSPQSNAERQGETLQMQEIA